MNLSQIEISKSNLLHNFQVFRSVVNSKTKILSVVKANAYGHGLEQVVSILDSKTDYFGVNDVGELRLLRKFSDKPTLVMGYVLIEDLEEAVKLDGTLVIYDLQRTRTLSEIGKKLNKIPKIHIKIDASLGRQGILLSDVKKFAAELKKIDNIDVEGIYAHFANIEDTKDFSHAKKQINEYKKALEIFKLNGFTNIKTHMSSTAASLVYEKDKGINNIVRIGIGLYGLWPSEEVKKEFHNKFELKPVMRWVAHIAQVKTVPAGFPIGYGLTFKTKEPTKIAIIPQGYSDGYDRGLSNIGEVLIKGRRCKILGRVAMNMFTVDVSKVSNIKAEDEVVLLGKQGGEEITAEEIAEKLGTINYEIVSRLSPLLPRVIIS